MNYKIRALLYFKDGSILPREVRQGEVIVGNSVPPSTSEEQDKKAGKKK